MEYNTQRKSLQFTDYGRNVDRLIEYAITIEDREERNKVAATIINTMAAVCPKAKESTNWQLRLWTHMMIISDWQLDVDIPEGVVKMDTVHYNPEKLPYKNGRVKYKHYGRFIIAMVEAVCKMPQGEEREELTALLANSIKRLYVLWNNDACSDEVVLDQIKMLSNGELVLPEDFKFISSGNILAERKKEESKSKKKRKK